MEFSQAQFDKIVEEIRRGLEALPGKIDTFISKVNDLLHEWWMTDPMAKVIKWAAEKVRDLTLQAIDLIKQAFLGYAAPANMFVIALDWQSHVRPKVTAVAGNVDPRSLKAPEVWKGDGADAYKGATDRQSDAAARIGTIAGDVASSLTISAGAGLAFYVAIASVVAELVAVLIASAAATATGEGALAGIPAAGIETGKQIALVSAAVAGVTAFITDQATGLNNLLAETHELRAFENNGHWPDGTA